LLFLQAIQDAHYSLFLIEATEPGAGVHLLDVLQGTQFFLLDLSLSRSGQPGMVFAGRVFEIEGVWRSTGTILPMVQIPRGQSAQWLRESAEPLRETLALASADEKSGIALFLIRNCLQHGAGAQVAYEEPGQGQLAAPTPPLRHARERVGRNDLCPCGSGKKFKQCCLRK
jgi:hypothetical protein